MLYFLTTPPLNERQQYILEKARDYYVERIVKASDLPLERVRAAHRMIQQNVVYPRLKLNLEGAINVSVLPDTDEGQHYVSAFGALINERANSYGIARALDMILTDPRIGISSQLVEGCVIDEEMTATMHLWNIITVEGRSYHVDTALDIMTNPQAVRRTGEAGKGLSTLGNDELPMVETLLPAYKYCLVSDDVLRANHIWRLDETPRCLSSYVPVKKM
ncbi:MAG: hypothetical protein U0N74_09530 [Peptococcaceae bacterium]|jgi:hypothetical protein|nr:hypothetical protein [Peptococcaceae bacterium]